MTKLFVGGLSFGATNEVVANLFRSFGVIDSVKIITDRPTGRSRGFGFVNFADPDAAYRAIVGLHDREFQGRQLHVSLARTPESMPRGPRGPLYRYSDSVQEFEAAAEVVFQEPEPAADLLPPLAEFLCDRPIIEISDKFSLALMKYIQEHPLELKEIDRRRFEELVAQIWSGFGYEVELTQQTRDGGVDVIAIRHSVVAERYLIECKRPNPGKPISVRPVRELYGIWAHARATKAILATTAHFSKDAIIFLEEHKWQLEGRDFDGLMGWINEYVHRKS